MTEVNFISLDKRFDHLTKPLREKALRVFKFLHKRDVAIDIYLINGRRMKALNKFYRNKESVTDVLAIEPPLNFPRKISVSHIGEVYLNPPHVRTKDYDLDFALVHGILHLLGFNHHRKGDKIEMEKEEKEISDYLRQQSEV